MALVPYGHSFDALRGPLGSAVGFLSNAAIGAAGAVAAGAGYHWQSVRAALARWDDIIYSPWFRSMVAMGDAVLAVDLAIWRWGRAVGNANSTVSRLYLGASNAYEAMGANGLLLWVFGQAPPTLINNRSELPVPEPRTSSGSKTKFSRRQRYQSYGSLWSHSGDNYSRAGLDFPMPGHEYNPSVHGIPDGFWECDATKAVDTSAAVGATQLFAWGISTTARGTQPSMRVGSRIRVRKVCMVVEVPSLGPWSLTLGIGSYRGSPPPNPLSPGSATCLLRDYFVGGTSVDFDSSPSLQVPSFRWERMVTMSQREIIENVPPNQPTPVAQRVVCCFSWEPKNFFLQYPIRLSFERHEVY